MKSQVLTLSSLQDFANALKKDYTHLGDYEYGIEKDTLIVTAEFYSHSCTYQIKLTKEQKAEVNRNIKHQDKHPYLATDVINADDDIISLFAMSLRKEIIDDILITL